MTYQIGDCRIILKEYPDDFFDSCVTDPPYGLEFMGKEWDKLAGDWGERNGHPDMREQNLGGNWLFGTSRGGKVPRYHAGESAQKFHLEWATEVFRVLKPGGYLLAFGGTRTYHRMVCAVEDAGFEIRDMIPWIYGSGFPKSLNIGKELDDYDGWGTALKPAIEPIVVARKPISEKNVALNVLKYGTGGINVGGCRIGTEIISAQNRGNAIVTSRPMGFQNGGFTPEHQGRFPANLILECTCEEVIPGKAGEPRTTKHEHTFGNGEIYGKAKESHPTINYNDTPPIHTNPNCPCRILDKQSGESKSTPVGFQGVGWKHSGNTKEEMTPLTYQNSPLDSGGASRFFYIAKASKRERYFYCSVCKKAYPGDKRDDHRKHMMHCEDCGVDYEPNWSDEHRFGKAITSIMELNNPDTQPSDHKTHSTKSNLLFHVTQKPEQLIRYLLRLVTPEGGTSLDPFLGSGTSLVAGHKENINVIGIEIGEEYEPIIKARYESLPRKLTEFA
ncbi:MAG: site-specific DNA-methyltransferase [Candidatus Aenigmatarchaeota archaeon]|nr:MAG: site-specific DNA-methyltransferase [Candidatus Aenigmarchaeota archaeon]